MLPPIDAVFACGSEAIGGWLRSHGWRREWLNNDNFRDKDIVRAYLRAWQREYPLYFESDVYAVLGGWRIPMADDGWHDQLNDRLIVFTIHDAEPWIEAWHTRDDQLRVVQRVT